MAPIHLKLKYLEDRLREQIRKHRIPGASVAVLHQGTVHKAAAGYANISTGVAVDTETLFDIGSITKVYTATLMMMLADDGLLAIDDPVRKYLPDLKIDGKLVPEAITIRSLLNHTSGIDGDYFEDVGGGDEALTRYVRACAKLPYLHKVGKVRSYCNTGFSIAGRVIEVVAGKPFNTLMTERLLRPIGTAKFGFRNDELLRYRYAVGHRWDSEAERFVLPKSLRLPEGPCPAGSLLAMTAADLIRFAQFHLNGGVAENGRRLLSSVRVAQMQAIHGEVPPLRSLLRLGWGSPKESDAFMLSHSGLTIDQNAFLGLIPEHGFAMAILTNNGFGAINIFLDLGAALIKEMCNLELGPPATLAPANEKLDVIELPKTEVLRMVGKYCASAGTLDLSVHDGTLRGRLAQEDLSEPGKLREDALTLLPIAGKRFVCAFDAPEEPRPLGEFFTEHDDQTPYTHLFIGARIYRRQAETNAA